MPEDKLPIKRQRVRANIDEAQQSAVTVSQATEAGPSSSTQTASDLKLDSKQPETAPNSVVSSALVSAESTESLRELYQNAAPYPHCVLKVVQCFDIIFLRVIGLWCLKVGFILSLQVFVDLQASSDPHIPGKTDLLWY